MTVLTRERPTRLPQRESLAAALRREPSAATASLVLLGIVLVSALARAVLVARVQAPTVFDDELGYEKLAQSIGQTGHLALFNNPGLSYSPLYPILLSPIYALGASAPTAYAAIKLVNAILISLAVVPTYKIARFVLPRRFSLIVAGLSIVAPLMTYSSFTMSENLAYPLCLVAIWAMLEAVARPSWRHDLLLLGAIGLACLARTQLVVLFPAALAAMVLTALLTPADGESRLRALLRGARDHAVVVGVIVAGLLIAVLGSLAGHDVRSIFGRYSNVLHHGVPNLRHFFDLFLRHLAGVDLAVGVAPFVAALVLAVVFFRAKRRPEHVAFAAVAVSVTVLMLFEVAFDAVWFDVGSDVPRIHERFLIYVVPFFLVALVAASLIRETKSLTRLFLGCAVVAALLPAAIPYRTVVNGTISIDTFSLEPYARVVNGRLGAIAHATLIAVAIASVLAFLYVHVRRRLRTVILLVLLPFVAYSGLTRLRIESTSAYGRSLLPAHADWVDRARPSGTVALLTAGDSPVSALQTAYSNLSIDSVYYLCRQSVGSDFGEQAVTIDRTGRLMAGSHVVRAAYAVVPWSVAARGRVVAWNSQGGEALVKLENGRMTVPAWNRQVDCSVARALR